jgi:hypothetical protein
MIKCGGIKHLAQYLKHNKHSKSDLWSRQQRKIFRKKKNEVDTQIKAKTRRLIQFPFKVMNTFPY